MDTLQAIKSRKSVRQYLDRPVEPEKLETILRAGNRAPNAGPFQMTVIEDKTLLKQINDVALEVMRNSGTIFFKAGRRCPDINRFMGRPF